MAIITTAAIWAPLGVRTITVILMRCVESLPSIVFDDAGVLNWSWSEPHGLRFLPWHHCLIPGYLQVWSGCEIFLFGEFVGASLWLSFWKWPPFISTISLRLCILIRAHILWHLISLLLLRHTMLIESIVYIVWLRWLSITWGPSSSIPFLFNYLLWSLINLWL